jgi:hypothetical protein
VPASKSAIHKAFRASAKQWHPDRFEGDRSKRTAAEERFKRIQVAFRELSAHFESPERWPVESEIPAPPEGEPLPSISFGSAPGCFAAPYFPKHIGDIIYSIGLADTEAAIGLVGLSPADSPSEVPSQYLVLTSHRMYMRGAAKTISVIWYSDLGDIEIVDQSAQERRSLWQWIRTLIAAPAPRYVLRIRHLNGAHFCSLLEQTDDTVKKVIYNFLRQMKTQSQS